MNTVWLIINLHGDGINMYVRGVVGLRERSDPFRYENVVHTKLHLIRRITTKSNYNTNTN